MKVASVAVRRARNPTCRFVALGNGFTEGVGDPDRHLPNGVRGWADRVAEGLARAAPGWEYANLAVRGRRLSAVVAEQLPVAMELDPTLVTVSVGLRDVLVSSSKRAVVLDRYTFLVSMLAQTGATVVLFATGSGSASGPVAERISHHNAAVRRIAELHGALFVDPWDADPLRAARMWDPGRNDLTRAGHAALADHLLRVLGVSPEKDPAVDRTVGPGPQARTRPLWMHVRDWLNPAEAVRPGTAGGVLRARWPTPVVVPPRGGLRALPRAGTSGPLPDAEDFALR